MSEKVTASIGQNQIIIETGKLAKQADGAVTIQMGETIVFVAAVAATKAKAGQDFFPLTVDYREKAAAAGKFPGGYFKREGRPTEKEILTSRIIDRPIRPLFPKGWYNEVQVQTIPLSADGENDPDMLALLGASAALMVSDIPWAGPLGACRVGRVNGQFIANPVHAQMAESDLDLVYVGNENDLVMYEGSAKEISEADFNAALKFAQEAIQPMIQAQKDLAARVGKKKREITLNIVPDEILNDAKSLAGDRIVSALLTPSKMARESAVSAIKDEVGKKLVEKFGEEKVTDFVINDAFYYIQKEAVRGLIMKDGKRLDGRDLETVRPIQGEVGILPRAHGSALFSRGETQAVVLATLGTGEDAQEFDSYTGGETEKKFILHYNFPNYSVGETGRISGPGRREIGHGALAERSIEPMLPLDTYPYAIRVTSEIMESNGSTSMATVCGGSLALFDAGVSFGAPVAGVAMGLIKEGKRYAILTDILGTEDHLGDMDFKVAGTAQGITSIQMDIKIEGLELSIMKEALAQAHAGRLHILGEMNKALDQPRADLSPYAPRIVTLTINPEKIGDLIGPKGKTIRGIQDETGAELTVDDTGLVTIAAVGGEAMERARAMVKALTQEPEIGSTYDATVKSTTAFGAFVEILPGTEGLVHISELRHGRTEKTEDVVKRGDRVKVKLIDVDERGRLRLSMRALLPKPEGAEEEGNGHAREQRSSRGASGEGREPAAAAAASGGDAGGGEEAGGSEGRRPSRPRRGGGGGGRSRR